MRDFRDAKAMAHSLREALKAKSVSLTHSESLELVARTLGLPDWNHLAARIESSLPLVPSGASATNTVSVAAGAGIPIVPMRDLVVFPQMVAPIFVGREKTRRTIERALATDRRVLVVTQRRSADDDPQLDALHPVGVTAALINRVVMTDGTLKLAISGLERAAVGKPVADEFLAAEIAPIEESNGQTDKAVLLSRLVLDAYRPARASRALVNWARKAGHPELVGTYIARRSRHNTGSAVDLTLVRAADGQRLRMGSRYDELTTRAHTINATGRALHNRLVLEHAMERFGFTAYWREWWHFERPAAGAPYLDLSLGC